MTILCVEYQHTRRGISACYAWNISILGVEYEHKVELLNFMLIFYSVFCEDRLLSEDRSAV